KDMTQAAEAQAREAAGEVNRQVHDNPWTAVGVAAGVGVLIGLLLGRK
ncbi:MAG: C-terminal glycine zipper region, partial [Burkholderiales bacterium]|nr:C-terminal glycine zipper region [Burkholderiales bacterium]